MCDYSSIEQLNVSNELITVNKLPNAHTHHATIGIDIDIFVVYQVGKKKI